MHRRIVLATLLTNLFLPGQIPDFKPSTPLLSAALTNDTKTVIRLLEEGADPNDGRFFGFPALTLGVINSNESMVQAMLAHGADVKATDARGSTALMFAVGSDTPVLAIVDELLKRGSDPNAENTMSESALTWATRRGDMRLIERLKAAGASDAGAVRRSVEKAVALLQKSGPQFVKVSGCTSCHHQSLPQMAYAAARQRGFHVDSAVSEQQVKAVMAMFKPIKEQMEKGTVTLPNPGISVSYSLIGLAAEGYAADDTTRAMTRAITRTQLPDGSFAVLPGRPPSESSRFTSTALSIRALQLYGEGCDDTVAVARKWLEQAVPTNSEERTMRLFGLVWSKASGKLIESAVSDLLGQQRPDGGWAQLEGIESDAYATGQAMAALYESRAVRASDKAWQRAVAYLLRTQLADGSWLVRTRSNPIQPLKDSGFPHGRDQWISAAGTSWAAIALALSQPASPGVELTSLFSGNSASR